MENGTQDARRRVGIVYQAVAIAQLGFYLLFITSLSIYAIIAGGFASAAPLFHASIGSVRTFFTSHGRSRSKGDGTSANKHTTDADSHSLVDYPPAMLRIYDATLLYNNTVAWGVTPQRLQTHFDASLSSHHLDIGVGSGYLPSHSKTLQKLFASKQSNSQGNRVRLALWDLNAAPLQYASVRVSHLSAQSGQTGHGPEITTRTVNVLDTDDFQSYAKSNSSILFTSISMFYLFHCVPNPSMRDGQKLSPRDASIEKFSCALSNMRSIAAKGATITGATLLTPDDEAVQATCGNLQYAIGSSMMDVYQNRFKHFYNHHDTLETIRAGAKRAGLAVESLYAYGFVAFFVFRKL